MDDQREASGRPDVLALVSETLKAPVKISGQPVANLVASTSGTDSDWVIKLVDVYAGDYPDPVPNPARVRMGGYQQLVRGDVFRGKFRNSFEKPEPFQPGKRSSVAFDVPDVFHTFRRGHRLMVHVQSSWFPLGDRNPQQFLNIYEANPSDFIKSTIRIHHDSANASKIILPILK